MQPYPLVTDLQHFGEEEQQQVGPGLSVALWGQSQEVRYSLTAHTAKKTRQRRLRKRDLQKKTGAMEQPNNKRLRIIKITKLFS